MSKDKLAQALEQQDWDNVLKHGALLCNNCKLNDAARLATDSALFILEHPEADAISLDLSKIVLRHLP